MSEQPLEAQRVASVFLYLRARFPHISKKFIYKPTFAGPSSKISTITICDLGDYYSLLSFSKN